MLVPALGVGDQELDRRLARRVQAEQPQRAVGVHRRLFASRLQRREPLPELRRERRVEHVQELLARAEVGGQVPHDALRALAEDAHVRVPEAVDRLELVPDREQVVALERLENPELDRVRVLELVDHDQAEALGPLVAGLLVGEQVAGAQLEVLEVDRRALGLGRLVRPPEPVQEPVQQLQGATGVVVGTRGPVRAPGGAIGLARVRGEGLGAALEVRNGERAGPRHLVGLQRERRLERVSARGHADSPAGQAQVVPGLSRRGRQRLGVGRLGEGRDGQARRRLSPRAQGRVGAEDELAQVRAVGGGEVDRGGTGGARPLFQRGVVGRSREALGGGLLEHLEARVQPGGERLGAQQAGAEAVDGADPGGVDGAGVLVLAELGQAPAQALGELARGLLGEGQAEDRVDRHAVDADGGGDPLDHHRGLARAGVGGQQRGAGAGLDRGALLGGEAPHERQIPGWAQPPL